MKNKKMALLHSVIALLLCVSMLVGSTFAWFTDSVKTGINTIAAGVLDVELYHSNAAVQNEQVNANTKLFMDLQGSPILWEPGVVSFENLRVANAGDLALSYQLALATDNENYIIDGNNQYGLSQILQVGVVEGGITATDRAGVVGAVTEWTTLASFLRSGSLLAAGEETWGVVVYWQPGEDDNRWNLNNGKTLSEGETLQIDLGVKLIATQEMEESDAIDKTYDENAKAEFFDGFQGGSAGAVVTADDQGVTTAEVAMKGGDVSAVIPTGVQVASGVNSLALTVTKKAASEANIQLKENEEMRPLDVHIEGVAQGNTVPMLITLKHYLSTGINTGALTLYHVENGQTVAMTQVANPANHNEFSYDPATGDVTLALASFSEVAVVADTNNPWDGTAATAFAGGTGKETDPYLIANADQLAYFRNEVDGGNTFQGKFVKLNNNIYLDKYNFDPIGWGYDYDGYTPNGKTFNGTFDGDHHFIFDLLQDGWDLGYSYSMAGGGLFASVVDATIKNVKISGANIRMECIDMGVLVGYSQGNCTYANIEIYNSKIANYQRSTGGVVGEVTCRRDASGNPVHEESVHTFENVKVHSDVVVGSLWGDFDASCGGVIGGRWDDNNTTKVVMDKVDVRCRLDVYNDITSAYQWHAYRRAGMLIGNTDLPYGENRLAQAPFLTCTDVDVYYGDWVNYTYCQFTNQSDASGNSLWYNNYPWVREQVGENCSAYSNVRYGHPIINGNAITDSNHEHDKTKGDECNVLRQFAQLYGGGQGVYGQHTHPGVNVKNYVYSITYVNDNKVLDITYVTDNKNAVKTGSDQAQKLVEEWAGKNITGTWKFGGWMNAGSTKMTEIKAGNTKNIVLYPYFNNPYTARFVDQQGNVIAYCFFHADKNNGGLDQLDGALAEATTAIPAPGKDFTLSWEVNANGTKVAYSKGNFEKYTYDVTIYPVYNYTGKLKLTPVDEEPADGIIEYYKVQAVAELDEITTIPGNVNGVPVKLVEKLYKNDNNWDFGSNVKTIIIEEGVEELAHNSLSHTKYLETVYLPSTIKKLNKNAFSRNTGDDKKELKIVYNGTGEDFQKVMDNSVDDLGFLSGDFWYGGLKEGSTVKCTDGIYTLTKAGSIVNKGTWRWTAN